MERAQRKETCPSCQNDEDFDKMMWKDGLYLCRKCYKIYYEKSTGRKYIWDDLDKNDWKTCCNCFERSHNVLLHRFNTKCNWSTWVYNSKCCICCSPCYSNDTIYKSCKKIKQSYNKKRPNVTRVFFWWKHYDYMYKKHTFLSIHLKMLSVNLLKRALFLTHVKSNDIMKIIVPVMV